MTLSCQKLKSIVAISLYVTHTWQWVYLEKTGKRMLLFVIDCQEAWKICISLHVLSSKLKSVYMPQALPKRFIKIEYTTLDYYK